MNDSIFYKNRVKKDSIIFETAKNVFINFNENDEYLKGFWLAKKLININEYSFYVTLNFPSSFNDLNYIEMKKNKKGEYDAKKFNSEYTEIKRVVLKGEKLNLYLKSIGFDI